MVHTRRIPRKDLEKALETGEARLSFSQFGEDSVLEFYLRNVDEKYYIDVGCHHPHRYSNTYLLYHALGWRGLDIDMDERAIARIREDRPENVAVCSAVSDRTGEIEATFFEAGGVNTVSPSHAKKCAAHRPVMDVRKVPCDTLDRLIEQHYPHPSIGLLSIDAEGHDLEVLRSIDLDRHRPLFILVETGRLNRMSPDILAVMTEHGYEIASHMVISTLFQRMDAD